jgi:hypothetical protein
MVWRRVLVQAAFTLRELHGVIQVAMGWAGFQLFWGSGSSGTESSIQPSSSAVRGSRSGLSSPRATVLGRVKA